MKELFYYSIFAIILYFVLTSVFDNFNLEQENFDPSLVPVSSIVTLAKVAQKLVNGNGTLTNPGNLQIGASASAPGNLTVTGSTTIGLNQPITLTSATANSTFTLQNDGGGIFRLKDNAGGQLLAIGQDGTIYSKGNGIVLDSAKNLTVSGNSTVDGHLIMSNNKWQLSKDGIQRLHFSKDGPNHYGSGNGNHVFRTGANAGGNDGMTLDSSSNLNVLGNSTLGGYLFAGTSTTGATIRVGELWGSPGIYAGDTTKDLKIHSESKNLTIGSSDAYPTNTKIFGDLTVTKNSTVTGNSTVSGTATISSTATVSGLLNAPGNIEIANGNPFITFVKSGQNAKPQLYSDGGTIHVYGGHLEADNNFTVRNTATFNNGLKICDPAKPTLCATLSYDSAKGMLKLDKGLELNNALSGTSLNPGLYTNNVIFAPTNRYANNQTQDSGSLENFLARGLADYSWIPNGSTSLVGSRNDAFYNQVWGANKGTGSVNGLSAGKTQPYYWSTIGYGGGNGSSTIPP